MVLINMPGQGNFGPRLAREASLVGVCFSKTDVRIEECTGATAVFSEELTVQEPIYRTSIFS